MQDPERGQPAGVTIEATVVFQFHREVQTKVDVPFNVRCFYMDAVKELDAGLTVSFALLPSPPAPLSPSPRTGR